MSYTTIPSGNIGALRAIIRSLWTLAKSNFEDHNSRINDLNAGGAPTGMIAGYGKSTPPTGWLICDGSVVSQVTYADLYAIIGANFNTGGEGAGNFRLPNLLGRVPIGVGTGSGLTARSLAATLGEETHVLTQAETPTHNHTLTDPGHNHGDLRKEVTAGGANTSTRLFIGDPDAGRSRVKSNTTGITFADAGSGSAHNTMQPFLVAAFIIKT